MYALIETGGKQYRVTPGDVVDVELLPAAAEAAEGDKVEFDRVLLVGDDDSVRVGQPVVEGAVVSASVVDHVRASKIRVFKMKKRKGYRRTNGHRQNLLRVRIEGITA